MNDTIHWADVVASELLKRGGKHRIATGITPSGHIHLGNLREMLTADAVRRAVIDNGGEAELVYIADTFDPLRKRYPFLPERYEEYVGMPLSNIPDPEGCHENYSEHFLQPFLESLEILGIPVRVEKAHEMYSEGRYGEQIRVALKKRDVIARIIHEVTGRELEPDWAPFMPLCESCGRINSAKVTGFDEDWIYYACRCGHEGRASYSGGGKLTWRVDWAARWKILGITCEPFGKDHAAAGGSYDTGVRLAREVFEIQPPFPVVYEWIHLKGKGVMKSSKGIVVPVREIVEILPPEIIRYLIIRVKPERHIEFDPLMILDVIDDFEDEFRQKTRNVELSLIEDVSYSEVPFRHLIVVGQIASWELEKVLEILQRTYEVDEEARKDVERRLVYARKWLEKLAPDAIKFEVKEDVAEITAEFSEDEKRFLRTYAEKLSEDMSPERIHQLVYEVAKETGIKPAKAFQAIYRAILDMSHGPRAGYFIKSLGVSWVRNRFRRVAG